MSDALTDIYRDQRRAEQLDNFYKKLIDYLNNKFTKKKLKELAESCDSIPTGYFGSNTKLSKNIDEWLKKLSSGDEDVWLKLLSKDLGYNYAKLKELSPFKNKILIGIDFGVRFSSVNLSLESKETFVDDLARRGLCTYDGDNYVMILNKEKFLELLSQSDVKWLKTLSAFSAYNTPIKSERKKLNDQNT